VKAARPECGENLAKPSTRAENISLIELKFYRLPGAVGRGLAGNPAVPYTGAKKAEAIMHHRRGKARNARAGCKLCKFWKVNGFRTERREGERFSDHRRRHAARTEARAHG
jgi:hypothetical protein